MTIRASASAGAAGAPVEDMATLGDCYDGEGNNGGR